MAEPAEWEPGSEPGGRARCWSAGGRSVNCVLRGRVEVIASLPSRKTARSVPEGERGVPLRLLPSSVAGYGEGRRGSMSPWSTPHTLTVWIWSARAGGGGIQSPHASLASRHTASPARSSSSASTAGTAYARAGCATSSRPISTRASDSSGRRSPSSAGNQPTGATAGTWRVRGSLTFNGRTHEVVVPVSVRVTGRAFAAEARFDVSLERFEVRRPRLLGIPIRDAIALDREVRATL